ncbi:hypothetical protein OEZ85_000722 [Tetradesmus obliquus]|uniref:RING-type domain-containing protein n=1 Tax=Tetradesmus obliquus TaxID=3088 RepID=A0ABY8UJ61_TETOB|nr:hypothetical protein OEZ85_000722 [Tetradesmus obliquus]
MPPLLDAPQSDEEGEDYFDFGPPLLQDAEAAPAQPATAAWWPRSMQQQQQRRLPPPPFQSMANAPAVAGVSGGARSRAGLASSSSGGGSSSSTSAPSTPAVMQPALVPPPVPRPHQRNFTLNAAQVAAIQQIQHDAQLPRGTPVAAAHGSGTVPTTPAAMPQARSPPGAPRPRPQPIPRQSYGLDALRALLSETQQQRQSRIMRSAADLAAGSSIDLLSPNAAALREVFLSSDMMQHMARMSTLFGIDAPDGGLPAGFSDAMMGGLGFGGRFGGGLSYEQLVNLEDVKVCVPAAVLDSLPRRHVAARAAAAAAAAAGEGDGAAAAGDVDDVICPVCQCELGGPELVVSLPCSHDFHDSCACQWLSKYSKKCPVCKKEVC